MKKTIEELEKLLNQGEKNVRINPDGTTSIWSPEDHAKQVADLQAVVLTQAAEIRGLVEVLDEAEESLLSFSVNDLPKDHKTVARIIHAKVLKALKTHQGKQQREGE